VTYRPALPLDPSATYRRVVRNGCRQEQRPKLSVRSRDRKLAPCPKWRGQPSLAAGESRRIGTEPLSAKSASCIRNTQRGQGQNSRLPRRSSIEKREGDHWLAACFKRPCAAKRTFELLAPSQSSSRHQRTSDTVNSTRAPSDFRNLSNSRSRSFPASLDPSRSDRRIAIRLGRSR